MLKPAFEMPKKVAAAPAPAPAAPAMTIDEAVLKYRTLRDKTKEIKARHAVELEPFNTAMDELETYLQNRLIEVGANSIKTPHGTCFKVNKLTYGIEDPATFRGWVESHGRPDFYENRVSKEAVDNWVAEGNPLPAGLKVSSYTSINIRK